MKLNVLILKDLDKGGRENPYLSQLIRHLDLHESIGSVQHGTEFLNYDPYKYDILHVQWPESLIRVGSKPDAHVIDSVISKIDKWGQKAKLVATIHNNYPHGVESAKYADLFKKIYERMDGFIHLGNASHKWILSQPYLNSKSKHCIIPHGNYQYFKDMGDCDRTKARNKLGYREHDFVILVFGKIRSEKEFKLVNQVFSRSNIPNKKLLFCSRIGISRKSAFIISYLRTKYLRKDIKLIDRFIDPEDVSCLLNAADVMFIPRINVLNSGNVALAFTYGKPVLGPDTGVIGETIRITDNPVYSQGQVYEAIKKMEMLSTKDLVALGERNLQFAYNEMSWSGIVEQHVSFYKQLLYE